MSFDGVFTHLMVEELNQTITDGRLSKIQQPYEHEIMLVFRNQGKNHTLLLSAHPSFSRIQLTTISYQNPKTPPNFCMTLRKYLEGSILEKIEQVENDRIIHFYFSSRNELGDLENILLIVELMGRHSNILLVNQATGKILDAVKHVGSSQNTYRQILPGSLYRRPPQREQLNPFTVDIKGLHALLATTDDLSPQFLQTSFQGLGKDTAQELFTRLMIQPKEKLKAWQQFFTELTTQQAPTLSTVKQSELFSPIPFPSLQAEKETSFHTLSELLDHYYSGKAEKDRVKQQAGELIRKLSADINKLKKKKKNLQKDLKATESADEYRLKGEILTTFLHLVKKSSTNVILENYYDNNQPIEIALNPALSANQNAQKYFHKYTKLRNGISEINKQLILTEYELLYLDSIVAQLDIASPGDVEVIREELIHQHYIKDKRKTKKKQKIKTSKPEEFVSSDGTLILVGKNNLQNDQLTLKTANKQDIWLHAKDIPGSHVIIRSNTPTEETLLEAAQLAAYFSKYRLSSQVPVDYVPVKLIRKPNGAKPGYVIYEGQKTLYVTPEEELIKKLKK
ncbi:NFACT RNA binding domain-containing protein [Vagococcus sp.]|uniref:NFACT RNA binding domain-containing protein n=1 Tax=Vagococcus sp. TaxID=1933889 RepID=UPI003F9AC19C